MVGIDISDRSIKIAELTTDWQPEVLAVGWQPIDETIIRRGVVQDVKGMVAALQQAARHVSGSFHGRVATASIPEFQSFLRILEVPRMSPGEMDEAVMWAVRPHIPFGPDRVYIDWQPLTLPAREARFQSVLVGAVRREVVDRLLLVLDAAGFRVVALELEAQSIVRSLLPREADDVRGVLLVDIGAMSTNVVFFDQGVMRFTTSVLQGGDHFTRRLSERLVISSDVAAEQKMLVGVSAIDNPLSVALREIVLELVREIEPVVRQVIAVEDAAGYALRSILISGGSANVPGIQEVFSEVFPGVPVQLGNPWTNLVPPGPRSLITLSKEDALHFTTAFGLALRREETG